MDIRVLIFFFFISSARLPSTCAGEEGTSNTSTAANTTFEEFLSYETYQKMVNEVFNDRATSQRRRESTTGIVCNVPIQDIVTEALKYIGRTLNIPEDIDGNIEQYCKGNLTQFVTIERQNSDILNTLSVVSSLSSDIETIKKETTDTLTRLETNERQNSDILNILSVVSSLLETISNTISVVSSSLATDIQNVKDDTLTRLETQNLGILNTLSVVSSSLATDIQNVKDDTLTRLETQNLDILNTLSVVSSISSDIETIKKESAYTLTRLETNERQNSDILNTISVVSSLLETNERQNSDILNTISVVSSSLTTDIQNVNDDTLTRLETQNLDILNTLSVVSSSLATDIQNVNDDTLTRLETQNLDILNTLSVVSSLLETDERQNSDILNILSAFNFTSMSVIIQNIDRYYLPKKDCSLLSEDTPSGIITLNFDPRGTHFVRTSCDQDTDGGGWTVILERVPHYDLKTATTFNLTFAAFKVGFGVPASDFWIGLQNLHLLTRDHNYELRVILTDFDDETAYAHYDQFHIEGEEEGYKLRVSGYRGDAGDSLEFHNGMMFSTYDLDRDNYGGNCAMDLGGGWWYNACSNARLMSNYALAGASNTGINWRHWKNNNSPLKTAIMMIRPTRK